MKTLKTLKTLTIATLAAFAALLSLPDAAFSQSAATANQIIQKEDDAAARAKEAHKKQVELDAAYKSTLDKTATHGPSAAADPWGNVRPATKPPAANR